MKLRMDTGLFTGPLRREIDRRIKRERDIEKAIRRGAATVLTTARRSIVKSEGGGNIRNKQGETASKPGNPPRNDFGNLQQTSRAYPTPGGASVVFQVQYAVWLEYGTRYIRPRPFLRPAIAQNKEKIEEFVREELRRFYRV